MSVIQFPVEADPTVTAECFAIATNIGEQHARRIMAKVVMLAIEPEDIEAMVNSCVDDFRAWLLGGGADPNDTEVAAQHVYLSLVKEAARISRVVCWKPGHA